MWEERQRSVLMEGSAALERTSKSLIRAEQSAVESENIGTSVINELSTQRESLMRASNRLGDIDATLNKSQQLINFMKRGIFMNKLILILIIISEIGILIGMIYWKFLRR